MRTDVKIDKQKGRKKERKTEIESGAPGLVDRVLTIHAGSRGLDSHRRHMSERSFRSNRPGYPHPVCSELKNSGIKVAIGDCSVNERRRWCPPYQELVGKPSETDSILSSRFHPRHLVGKRKAKSAKLYMCTQTHYKHDEDGCTTPGVRGYGSVSLSHSGNVVTRTGLHTHTHRERNRLSPYTTSTSQKQQWAPFRLLATR